MFDRYQIGPPSAQTVRQEVHEHRAPTDESVRIIREMEEEALGRVVARMELRNNFVANSVLLRQPDPLSLEHMLAIGFTLNGRQHLIKATVPSTLATAGRDAFAEAVYKKIAEVVAMEVFGSIRSMTP